RRLLALALAAPLGLGACKTGPDLAVDYGQTAQENYELAVGEFEDRDWEEAVSYADFVRIRFPFSRYAVEAELLVARAEFEQGNYAVSQDAFKQFGRLHPTHRHVRNGWVAYMAAVSAFMNAPDGVGIMPPYYQRDQTGLREALGELGYFFDHFAGSPLEPNAVKLRDEINRRLLEHELYVARFYLDKKRPEAAIGRLEAAHADFPGIGLDAEVLFLLGVTYLQMEEIELSRGTFAELQAQHPTHHHGKQARLYLKYIYDTYGPADPSRARPDRSPPKPSPPPRPKNPHKPTKPEEGPEPGESAPGESKPGESKPGEAKPAEAKPETKPASAGASAQSTPTATP
ncbi:MAG: outer membrane protein assembly factor BamD, partial [Myxococcales bacterium]|nr:outer membrane protein assembly factor BamD [Myxococcales bacterium]